MPKMKTNKGAAKRFMKTKSGEFKRGMSGTRHLKTAKSPKRKRVLRKGTLMDEAEKQRLKRMLPYS